MSRLVGGQEAWGLNKAAGLTSPRFVTRLLRLPGSSLGTPSPSGKLVWKSSAQPEDDVFMNHCDRSEMLVLAAGCEDQHPE